MKEAILLFLVGLSFAIPACPYYPYHDYVEASQYKTPQEPADTLLQYCDFNLNPICILTNILNTTQDKKTFLAESIANGSFDNIFQWNQNVQFGKWFDVTKSSTNIKDAWVDLAYFNPSVYDNGTYLLNSTSKAFIKQNFTFVVDTSELPGDCEDDFRICGYDYSVSSQNSSSNITATLSVRSEYLVDRYHWVTNCDMTGCWVTCDYYATDDLKDGLSVSDSKKVKYQNFSVNSNYSISDYYNDLADILINVNNSNVHFQMGNTTFDKTDYLYHTKYELDPYNVLVKELIPENKTAQYGLSILERNDTLFRIAVPYSENCSLTVIGHFESKTLSGCALPVLNESRPFQKVEVVHPPILDSLFYLISLGVAAYVLYQIVRKVMPNV